MITGSATTAQITVKIYWFVVLGTLLGALGSVMVWWDSLTLWLLLRVCGQLMDSDEHNPKDLWDFWDPFAGSLLYQTHEHSPTAPEKNMTDSTKLPGNPWSRAGHGMWAPAPVLCQLQTSLVHPLFFPLDLKADITNLSRLILTQGHQLTIFIFE